MISRSRNWTQSGLRKKSELSGSYLRRSGLEYSQSIKWDHFSLPPSSFTPYLSSLLLSMCWVHSLLRCKTFIHTAGDMAQTTADFNPDSVQFSSVAQSCPTLWDPMNHSTPGLPVHHYLPEFTQTYVHRVGEAIQPSHPLSSPFPPAPNPSQHQYFPIQISNTQRETFLSPRTHM